MFKCKFQSYLLHVALRIQQTEQNKNASAFLHDTQRLILGHRSAIDQWPLQIYFSAIIFAPQQSIIRNMFSDHIPSSLSLLPQVDVDWNACLATLEGHSGSIESVAFSPDSQRLASGSWDWTVKLWDPRTGACTATLEGHSDWINSVAFSPDSQLLASSSDDGTVKLWDPRTGACTATLEGHSDSIESGEKGEGHSGSNNSVAFSADSQRLASGSGDRTVKLWDPRTGACTATLEGHSSVINSVAFSPDSQRLASGSGDRTVKLWDLRTGACTASFEVGKSIQRLSFGKSSSTLHTNAGVLKLDSSSMLSRSGPGANLQTTGAGIGLSNQSTWISWGSSNIIWLPPPYRGLPAVMGSTLAVGCSSGRVYVLRYSPE